MDALISVSAQPVPSEFLERLAENYFRGIVDRYENGHFSLFKYKGIIYSGVSQYLTVLNDDLLVRIIKVQQPTPRNLLDLLVKKANPPIVMKVEDLVDFENRGLFYANLKGGNLHHLTREQQTHLMKENKF